MRCFDNAPDQAARGQSRAPLPAALEAVALVSAKTASAAGEQSVAGFLEDVRTGRAPAPVIRGHRYTRWRLADIKAHWEQRASGAK